jgi:hypothetical protein
VNFTDHRGLFLDLLSDDGGDDDGWDEGGVDGLTYDGCMPSWDPTWGAYYGCGISPTFSAQGTGTSTTINVSHLSTTSSQALDVQNDLRWLEQAIAGDPSCESWLGKNESVSTGIGYMLGNNPGNQMMVGVGSFSGSGTNAVAGTNGTNMTPGSMQITINTNGAFFNASAGVGFGVPSWILADSPAEQGLILLHELAHGLGAPNFIQNDGPINGQPNVQAQTTNNQLVMQNCGSIINSLGGH